MSVRVHRVVAAGALAAAVVAAPAVIVLSSADDGPSVQATPQCLAWFGNKEDGKCMSYSNSGGGNGPINGGLPQISVGGPYSGSPGLVTGPLLPGQSWNVPLG